MDDPNLPKKRIVNTLKRQNQDKVESRTGNDSLYKRFKTSMNSERNAQDGLSELERQKTLQDKKLSNNYFNFQSSKVQSQRETFKEVIAKSTRNEEELKKRISQEREMQEGTGSENSLTRNGLIDLKSLNLHKIQKTLNKVFDKSKEVAQEDNEATPAQKFDRFLKHKDTILQMANKAKDQQEPPLLNDMKDLAKTTGDI